MKVFKYILNCMLTNYIGKFRPRISTNKFDLNMYLLNFKTNKTAKVIWYKYRILLLSIIPVL